MDVPSTLRIWTIDENKPALFAMRRFCLLLTYFAGTAGAAGVLGAAGCDGNPCNGVFPGPWGMFFFCSDATGAVLITELPFVVTTARERDVSINTIAAIVVILLKMVAAPRAPNRVCPEPPKAAPSSAPLPLWIRTMKIRKILTIM
jgi:hypothetical protein